MIDYTIVKEIKTIGDKGKALNVVKWGDHAGKLTRLFAFLELLFFR